MKIFAVDMDGTFLNNNNTYDKGYFKRLNDEFKDDFKLIVASSNTISHLQTFFDKADIFYIGSNGAVVAYDGEIIKKQFVDSRDLNEVITFLNENNIYSYVISTLESSYVNKLAGETFINRMYRYYNNLIIHDEINIKDSTKITIEIQNNAEQLIKQINKMCVNSVAVDSGYNCIDIIHKDTNKAVAVKKVLSNINASVNDLYVFGDSDNDIEMLSLTQNSFAMANANENVKSIAKYEIPSNNENGVLLTMEKILKKEL